MNDLPHFQPHGLASSQLSSVRLNKITLGQTASEIKPGLGYMSSRTPGGTTLAIKKQRTSAQIYPNLWVSAPFSSGDSFKVRITPGYLTYQQLLKQDDAGGPLYYLTPTIDGNSIETLPPPELTLAGATCKVYLHCTTDNRGVPNMTPEILSTADDQISTHHVPESVDDNQEPVDGNYYWLLADIEQVPDSDPVSLTVKRRLTGDRFIPNQIDRLKNIGDGTNLYWGFDATATNALHKLRSLANATESGAEPLIKPLDSEADETVKVKAIAAGTGITVTSSATAVTVAAEAVTAGWWGVITYMDGGGDSRLRETFEDGRMTQVEIPGSGGGATWQVLPGTQASPGAATVIVL